MTPAYGLLTIICFRIYALQAQLLRERSLSGSPGGKDLRRFSLNQVFGFGFPSYGMTLSLNLPVRNRAAQADLGTALVSRRHDLYSDKQLHEQIALEVSNAVHSTGAGKTEPGRPVKSTFVCPGRTL